MGCSQFSGLVKSTFIVFRICRFYHKKREKYQRLCEYSILISEVSILTLECQKLERSKFGKQIIPKNDKKNQKRPTKINNAQNISFRINFVQN